MLRFLREKVIWKHVLSSGANNFVDWSICLFIQFPYFFVDDLVSNYGQEFVFQIDDNLFSSFNCSLTSESSKVKFWLI